MSSMLGDKRPGMRRRSDGASDSATPGAGNLHTVGSRVRCHEFRCGIAGADAPWGLVPGVGDRVLCRGLVLRGASPGPGTGAWRPDRRLGGGVGDRVLCRGLVLRGASPGPGTGAWRPDRRLEGGVEDLVLCRGLVPRGASPGSESGAWGPDRRLKGGAEDVFLCRGLVLRGASSGPGTGSCVRQQACSRRRKLTSCVVGVRPGWGVHVPGSRLVPGVGDRVLCRGLVAPDASSRLVS